jgi:hypothetical protein
MCEMLSRDLLLRNSSQLGRLAFAPHQIFFGILLGGPVAKVPSLTLELACALILLPSIARQPSFTRPARWHSCNAWLKRRLKAHHQRMIRGQAPAILEFVAA